MYNLWRIVHIVYIPVFVFLVEARIGPDLLKGCGALSESNGISPTFNNLGTPAVWPQLDL